MIQKIQNQILVAILFLYRYVLNIELEIYTHVLNNNLQEQ